MIDLYQFFLHIYILIVANFIFARKNLIFCGISTAVFLVSNSSGYLKVQDFFLLSILCVSWGIYLKVIETGKLFGLDSISV